MHDEPKLPWHSRLRRWLGIPYPELECGIVLTLERLNCAGQQTRQCRELERAKQEGWFKRDGRHRFNLIQNDLKKQFRKTTLYRMGWRLRISWGGTPMAMYVILVKETPHAKRTLHLLISYYDVKAFRKVCNGFHPHKLGKLLPYRYDALETLVLDL